MARTRTTKTLAQRIDLNYFKRPTPLKRAKLWLSVLAPALALAWVAWLAAAKDSRAYSSGRLSAAHAVQCDACHARNAGAFSAKAERGVPRVPRRSDASLIARFGAELRELPQRTPGPGEPCRGERRGVRAVPWRFEAGRWWNALRIAYREFCERASGICGAANFRRTARQRSGNDPAESCDAPQTDTARSDGADGEVGMRKPPPAF